MSSGLHEQLKKLYPDWEYGWHTEHITNSKIVQEINRILKNEEKLKEILDKICEILNNLLLSDSERCDKIDLLLNIGDVR